MAFAQGSAGRDRTWLVAVATAMWGTDALFRKPLATSLPSASVVFWEHVIIVLLLAPFLPRAWRAFRACGVRERIAVVVIGVGSSALATALFTAAFKAGDPVTPLVLQKLQPIFAAVASLALLRERIRGRYLAFALPALAGAWLLAFPDPLGIQVSQLRPVLLALGAAVLWAAGTVLGRMVSTVVPARDVTTLRFAVGLPSAALILLLRGDPVAVGWENAPGLVLLALVPGLLALWLYYVGLRTTPAARATLAELSFPATAAIVGVGVLGAELTATQWVGFTAVVAIVAALGWHERVSRTKLVTAPEAARRPAGSVTSR
ncbi:EamA-like transporter family protein [Saccharopolyspora erythraea NRRL 2338]|uniref:Drug/metabolite transporter (DMT) superfamily protein n=2 Tax=Saccharopolyspora erythraea TaxID=1836 RepID=A4FQB8_SACEN|nr:DMT family transporter [Saccharopolyspora erythraea]EQD86281.1 multidrug DMT transporter permease [Saccharopolyspora erythraea D]PFG92843.1 EamA-like transporter family protein [Saccharopolyspora erythraea NRRL 2338]QRK89756.1 DMT family transporter [Saccharopolyspora erythraea]CAM06243.1 drug/metabolite transporter (DMT) superfamily protein [Saccharopolyspora erythraea NRRL 2338]